MYVACMNVEFICVNKTIPCCYLCIINTTTTVHMYLFIVFLGFWYGYDCLPKFELRMIRTMRIFISVWTGSTKLSKHYEMQFMTMTFQYSNDSRRNVKLCGCKLSWSTETKQLSGLNSKYGLIRAWWIYSWI